MLKTTTEADSNITVQFGSELIDFVQDEACVTASVTMLGNTIETIRGDYLVGCDGGGSFVRKKLGINFEGRGNIRATKQICFRSESFFENIPVGKGRHYYVADKEGGAFIVQGSRKEITLNAAIEDGADLEYEVRKRAGFDFDFELLSTTDWKLHLLVAERYRDRRVFIAGDSAHLVIPTGGLGMNTGVGDAFDLSWKLAGTIAGWAGPGVLDSYEPERRKVGLRNCDASGWAAAGMAKWRAMWQPEISEDTKAGSELRAEVGAVAVKYQQRIYSMIGVELGYSYAGSDLVAFEPDNISDWETTEYTPHARPGVRLPHMWLADGRAIQDVLGDNYSLIDLSGTLDTSKFEQAFDDQNTPLKVLHFDEPEMRSVYECSLLLLRPDLYVFWRGEVVPSAGEVRKLSLSAVGRA